MAKSPAITKNLTMSVATSLGDNGNATL